MKKNYKNILVYSGGEAIGDALYKLKFIQNLRYAFPNSEISWLAGQGSTQYSKSLKPIIKKFLNEIIDNKQVGASPFKELFFRSPLYGKHYDVIIDTQTVVLPTICVKKIKHNIFLSSTANWYFSDLKPINFSIKNSSLNKRLEIFIELLTEKEMSSKKFKYNFKLDKKYYDLAKNILPKGPTYIGFSPGAGDDSKKWPLEKFLKLAKIQLKNNRIPIFFLGPKEKTLLEIIKKEIPNAIFPEWTDKAINSGLKGPLLAIALAKQVNISVANDSGTGHMLAVGGTKLISLFSKHSPVKYAPNAEHLIIIDSKKWGGTNPDLIPIEEVENSINKFIFI